MRWLKAIFLIISLVNSQRYPDEEPLKKPEGCIMPTEFMHEQCCVFPPFFTREVARKCGARSQIIFIDTNHNVSAFRRLNADNDNKCDYWSCVLKEYRLITSDGFVDDEKYFIHLDKWADLNPSFITVITNARVHCKNFFRMFMPLEVCQFWKLNTCIRNFVNADCPIVIPSKKCQALKLFFDECREYYV